jgi:hypothetical protein
VGSHIYTKIRGTAVLLEPNLLIFMCNFMSKYRVLGK